MHATLPSLGSSRDRRMDITALCEPVAAVTTGTSANDAYELEVQAQMQQMSHHSWPLYRVEQDRILDRRERRAASTRFQHLDAAAVAHSSSLGVKAPSFMIDNPLVIAANCVHALPPVTTSLAPYAPPRIPPLRHLELPPRLTATAANNDDGDDESPIAVLSAVALATQDAPHAQRPPPAPSSRPRKAAAPASTTTAPSKKRSRRMSNSERGKLYRSRRKTYVESLESDVQDLAQEVQGLEIYGRILQEMALHTPASNGGSYSRVVAEYFSVFASGMPVNPDEPSELALVRPTPRQSVFVRTLMAPDMAFCGTGGPKRLLHNWQCFSLYHASLSYSLTQLQVILPEPTAVVSADAVLRVRLTRATVEKMFPHVLWNEALVQKLIGREVTYNVGNRFFFGEDGKITRYESHVDFLSTFMAALGSLRDAIEVAGPITERQQREQHSAPTDSVEPDAHDQVQEVRGPAEAQAHASSETETDSDATE